MVLKERVVTISCWQKIKFMNIFFTVNLKTISEEADIMRFFSHFSVQLISLCCFSLGMAQFQQPHIVVYGEAETPVIPDKLAWSLVIKNSGDSITTVADRHVSAVTEVMSYLKNNEIADQDIQTSRMQLVENFVYKNNSRLQEGYYGLTQIDFVTDKLNRYVDFWKELSEFDHLTITGAVFRVSKKQMREEEAELKALTNSRAKAEKLSHSLGAQISEILLIEEFQPSTFPPLNRAVAMEMSGAAANSSPVYPGQEIIRARIKAVFSLIPLEKE